MNKPYVFICTGMSLDGKISTFERKQTCIATNDDKRMLYEFRIKADAVMIGGKSINLDDPKLTLKLPDDIGQRIKDGKSEQPITVAVITDASDIRISGDYLSTSAKK